MNKIKILSSEQAMKIAAGEVVERPVNIIKELVENSIDAGATQVTIFVERAGKKLIKIIDNGSGMSADDAKLSVAQHATSKITCIEDLETIATFGFRGEALASINAVSNLSITTKTAGDKAGTTLQWNFGKLQETVQCSHATGTTILITNLFDNIPARQKFLKKDETEWRAIVTLFHAFCLDYPHIHFQLYQDSSLYYNCPAVEGLKHRASQIFDTHFQKKSLELVQLDTKMCTVEGIISSSDYYRYDRNQIFIFVNHRWIKNIDITKAIMRGYAGTLPAQKYPAAIIFITIKQDDVDVNIHPKKEEVKFLHPKKVETIISQSIQATLAESLTANNTITKPFQHAAIQPSAHQIFTQQSYNTAIEKPVTDSSSTLSDTSTPLRPAPFSFLKKLLPQVNHNHPIENNQNNKSINIVPAIRHFFTAEQQEQSLQQDSIEEHQTHVLEQNSLDITILGQYQTTYILYEKDTTLVFVDQHAAHERILYEEFKHNFAHVATITLLFPEFITLSAHDIITITPYLAILQEHGIHADIFSDTQLLIQATPIHLKSQSLTDTIKQIIGWIVELEGTDHTRLVHILHEKIHTKMACSAAIKAGDTLNFEQMHQLLTKLHSIEHRFSCPHGRPTFWTLPIDYITKQFKRNYEKKAEQLYDFL